MRWIALALVVAGTARAQTTVPPGTYAFQWAGIDTNETQIARGGTLPAVLPAIGRLASGTLVITPDHRYTVTWTVRPLGGFDTTKTVSGVVTGYGGTGIGVRSDRPGTSLILTLVPDPPRSANIAMLYSRNGNYYLLPSKMVRIGLRPIP